MLRRIVLMRRVSTPVISFSFGAGHRSCSPQVGHNVTMLSRSLRLEGWRVFEGDGQGCAEESPPCGSNALLSIGRKVAVPHYLNVEQVELFLANTELLDF